MSHRKFDPDQLEQRGRRRRMRELRRNYFEQLPIDPATPVAAACHFLLSWDAHHYPGIGRGLRQLCNNRIASETARKWRRGNPAPLWAMEALADAVRSRVQIGLAVECALLAVIEQKRGQPRKPRGLEIIDPDTGLPKYRYRMGQTKSTGGSSLERTAAAARIGDREL